MVSAGTMEAAEQRYLPRLEEVAAPPPIFPLCTPHYHVNRPVGTLGYAISTFGEPPERGGVSYFGNTRSRVAEAAYNVAP